MTFSEESLRSGSAGLLAMHGTMLSKLTQASVSWSYNAHALLHHHAMVTRSGTLLTRRIML